MVQAEVICEIFSVNHKLVTDICSITITTLQALTDWSINEDKKLSHFIIQPEEYQLFFFNNNNNNNNVQ